MSGYDQRALAADFGRITGYVAAPARHATNTIMASHWAQDKHGVRGL
eukprot:gene5940-3082_t